ncbi:MAG: phage tail protein I [Acidobacteriota bacterium]
MTARLLPPNATPFERAMEDATAARLEAVPTPISTLYTPAACPAPAVPWLAWALDVPVWNTGWSETVKRGICAASWRLHRRQGTLGGLKALAGWAGAQVVRAVVPPSKRFAGASLTTAERNGFLLSHPQLRIYRHRTRGKRIQGALFGRAGYSGACWPAVSDATLRIAPQAVVWRAGAETPLTVMERTTQVTPKTAVTISTVAQRAIRGLRSFCGSIVRWPLAGTAGARLYTLRVDTPYLDASAVLRRHEVSPGLQPITVHPDHVAEPGQGEGIFTRGFCQGFWRTSTARLRLYDRLFLFDPQVATARRGAGAFLSGHLGMAPHTAILQVAIRGHRPAKAFGRFLAGCARASDSAALDKVRTALAWGKRCSDRLFMDTTTRRPLRAGARWTAGVPMAGQLANA